MKFVQLHTHTYFSVLDGIISPEEYVKKAKEFGMKSLAITDHGSMSGLLRFSNECRKEGIKGIMGCEFYINNDRDNEKGKESGTNKHIVLLAKNEEGYKNMLKINYDAMDKGFYYRGRTTEDFIFKNRKGIICLSACLGGPISTLIREEKNKEAMEKAALYKRYFKDDFYIELHFNELEEQIKVNKVLLKICKALDIKYVITGDCHYLNRGDENLQDLTLMISQKKTMADLKKGTKDSDKNVFRFSVRCLWFHHPKDYLKFNEDFGYNFPRKIMMKGIHNTSEVADKCNYMIEAGRSKFPKFINEEKMEVNAEKIIDNKCWKIFDKKINVNLREEYRKRLRKELSVIKSKGFSDYFLIIEDIINFCKKEKIAVGAGRGSAAGSLVSYLLGITRIDPLKYNLLFERFLNKDRQDPPDIDLDFESDRKLEIEVYLKEKYGYDRVVHIVTFSTFRIKGALRDIFKVHLKEKDKIFNNILKKIKDEGKATISIMEQIKIGEWSKEEKIYINENIELFKISDKLVGRIKNMAQHAGGTAITPGPIYDYIPVHKMKGEIVTGFIEGGNYRELSELGILKIDILGLDQISILDEIRKTVKEYTGAKIDYDNINLEDEKLYHGINNYNSDGIFQFESAPIYEFLKKVNPKCFEDIVAINALYRPAIINAGELDKYLERRKKRIEEDYKPKTDLDKILEVTYGTIAYQEQFMEILHKIGEFTLEEADKSRKIFKMLYLRRVSTEDKKEDPELLKVVNKFRKGVKNKTDFSDKKIENLINKLSEFAEYSFNRSHSVSYAVIAMQTLYSREYYPLYFYCALLNRNKNSMVQKGFKKINKSKKYLYSARRRDIDFLPIDISRSSENFKPEDTEKGKKIRMGLIFIPGLGINVAKEIVENAPYGKISMFCIKELKFEKSNKTAILKLIKIGAFDRIESNRRALHDFFEEWSTYKSKYKEENTNVIKKKLNMIWKGGVDERVGKNGRKLKSHVHDGHCGKEDWIDEEKEVIEKEVCNFNVFSQVENEDEAIKKIHELKKNNRIIDLADDKPEPENDKQFYCFKILSYKELKTKNGKNYSFMTVEDWNGIQKEVVIFQPYWGLIKDKIIEDRYYISNGYWQDYDGSGKIRLAFKNDDWGSKIIKVNGKRQLKYKLFYFKQLLDLKNIL